MKGVMGRLCRHYDDISPLFSQPTMPVPISSSSLPPDDNVVDNINKNNMENSKHSTAPPIDVNNNNKTKKNNNDTIDRFRWLLGLPIYCTMRDGRTVYGRLVCIDRLYVW
jgi:hypothetical protein